MQKSTPAKEWFKVFFADKYKEFDEEGLPTVDINGKKVSDSIRNKLKKEQKKQEEVHAKWVQEQSSQNNEEVKQQ